MNTETITPTTHTSIFDTKEQYLTFRANWKRLHAEGFHKPKRIDYRAGGSYVRDPETKRLSYVDGPAAHFMVSPLTVWHHLVFNLALGRDPKAKAFQKIKGPLYSWNNSDLWHAIGYTNGATHDFTPFGDTLTDEQKTKLLGLVAAFRQTV